MERSDTGMPERFARAGLTDREVEVLWAVAERLRNREIAARFYLSVRTVETHVAALLRKLGVPDRAALAEIGAEIEAELRGSMPRADALPVPLTSLVGREAAAEEIVALAASHRMVTLVGPGGVGKTRLAMHVASREAEQFRDGARLADLAPIGPELVADTLARALGVVPQVGWELRDVLREIAGGMRCLLLIDNCEHVVAEVAEIVADLLSVGPRLRVLATSREPLGVPGEATYQVQPLPIPAEYMASVAQRGDDDAVRLFVERAAAVAPGFALTDDNVADVVAVCRRLDGIPLAIELAAGRVRSFGPAELLRHLDQRFDLLAAGARTAAPRHRTLRDAIEWSYRLLDDDERELFDRFGVFPADFDFDAAQAVWNAERPAVLTILPRLVDKSVVSTTGHHSRRYRLLESLRVFATERLAETDETLVRQQHAKHYLAVAEHAAKQLHTADQRGALARLKTEQPNLRAGLAHTVATGDVESSWRWIAALQRFWDITGQRPEAWTWVERTLALGDPAATAEAVAGLVAASTVRQAADVKASYELARRAERLAADLGDFDRARAGRAVAMGAMWVRPELTVPTLVDVLGRLGEDHPWERALTMQHLAQATADLTESQRWGRTSVQLFRAVGDQMFAANTLFIMAQRSIYAGVADVEVDEWLAESQELAIASGSEEDMVHAKVGFGQLAWLRGDHAAAATLMRECLTTLRRLGDQRCTGRALHMLGVRAFEEGQVRWAEELLRGSVDAIVLGGQSVVLVSAVEALAAVAHSRGRPRHAAVLLGAARSARESADAHMRPLTSHDGTLPDSLVDALGDKGYADAFAEGGRMSPLEALHQTAAPGPIV
jgi:predicted ATPase/DNA-binding CsgD family transcriptional regulator